jgi:uncharacterized membrane protein YphA (DoxX/SURF4 family)
MLNGPSFPPNTLFNTKFLSWSMRILSAGILAQSLYYKFGGHPDSVYLFSLLGAEPLGRYLLGSVELVICILILIPRTTLLGALMGVGIMSGALMSHFLILGINFNGDGGKLFTLAAICFVACLIQCYILKNQIISYVKRRYVI